MSTPAPTGESGGKAGGTGVRVAVFLLGLVVLGQVATSAYLVVWLHRLPDIGSVLEDDVDRRIDAGFAAPTFDPADPLLASRRILITHEINQRTAYEVVARLLHLDALDPAKPIDLVLSSSGGWDDETFAIIDAMRLIKAPVNTWALGGCHSSCALILAAGTGRRRAGPNAIIMVHANLQASQEPYDYDRLTLARYEGFWKQAAKLPAAWFPMTFDKSYYLTAAEALEMGIIDAIAGGPDESSSGHPGPPTHRRASP